MKNVDLSLRVVGVTDPTGSAKLNLGIAQKRASAVVDMLVAQGVDRSRLQIVTKSGVNAGAATADPRERRVIFELSSPDEPRP